jgi:hypothetical protein
MKIKKVTYKVIVEINGKKYIIESTDYTDAIREHNGFAELYGKDLLKTDEDIKKWVLECEVG